MSKKNILKYASLNFLGIFIAICGIASPAIIEGVKDQVRFGTPDNLGFGIGFGIIVIFGLPVLSISILLYVLSRKCKPTPNKDGDQDLVL